MSDGDGGAVIVVGAMWASICWLASVFAIPIGLAMVGDILLWTWYLILAVIGAIITLAAFGHTGSQAFRSRDTWWKADVILAPIVTFLPAFYFREAERTVWLSLFHELSVLLLMFLFFYLIGGAALSLWGLSVTEVTGATGIEGAIQRLICGYLPMFIFYSAWIAAYINTVDPKP